jgi:hypothetical protein
MAVSPVDICNVALAMLGAGRITSLTDPTKAAQLCNAIYETARDETLQDFEWNFAQVRGALAQMSETPVFGFNYMYALPTSPYALRINEVDPDDAIYTIESNADGTLRVLLTDEPTINVRYTAQITDPSLYSKTFILAFANHIAMDLALPLTGLPAVVADMTKKYEARISRAMTADSQEGSTQIADINVLLDVRQHGFESFDRSRNRLPSGASGGFGAGGFGA